MEHSTPRHVATKHLDTTLAEHTRDMSGQVVAITGTTSGTGYVCARELGRLGARVLLLNRESPRATASLAKLRAAVPDGTFEPIVCDLQDFDSVRAAAEAIASRVESLDVLCNNAAIMAFPEAATKDGYDVQMQTNAIAPFLLTKSLFPLLKKSDEARIVNHSSNARLGRDHEPRYFGQNSGSLGGDGTEEENAQFSGPRWERYHQSKLANCTFAFGLKARIEAKGLSHIKVVLAHPGLSWTGLASTSADTGGMDLGSEFMSNAQSAEDGALGILRGCADPTVVSGDFFGPAAWTGPAVRLEPEPLLFAEENVRIQWEGCEAAVGVFEV